jgi:hypothetical protein
LGLTATVESGRRSPGGAPPPERPAGPSTSSMSSISGCCGGGGGGEWSNRVGLNSPRRSKREATEANWATAQASWVFEGHRRAGRNKTQSSILKAHMSFFLLALPDATRPAAFQRPTSRPSAREPKPCRARPRARTRVPCGHAIRAIARLAGLPRVERAHHGFTFGSFYNHRRPRI